MKKKKVELFEGERASNYEEFVDTWIPNYRYFMNLMPRMLQRASNKRLLVVGCGTGNEILSFKNAPERWKITGVDPSPQMLAQARRRLSGMPKVELIDGVVGQLPIMPQFGAATLLLVLHFFKDDGGKLALLQDIQKRIKPNAPFILLDITGDREELAKNVDLLLRVLPEEITEVEKKERKYRILNYLETVSEERLAELLVKAGFEEPTRFYQSSIYKGWFTRKIKLL